ncbi:hypothetical protein LNTAR_20188 [Lentisphaera araneosa HTCC2155]|uniref:DUF6576 domain-containing protein n=1 Tax=Lentisphaera araneosa HTCC2155 TaxID=313628 RepID=A6DKW0_9BACT|nr:DUF6576 domain-containing protein [Lentisphaera araneosa]EDM27562.1 hypothetical protein LNTAR_20188 [Lentisphaera araneosa HTCC2155]
MLSDREYIKTKGPEKWPLLKVILGVAVLINVAVFLTAGRLWDSFALSLVGLKSGWIWQLFTSFFLASSDQLFSFVFDLLIFYFAAQRLEEAYGESRLRLLYKKLFAAIAIAMPVLLLLFFYQSFAFLSALMLGTVCAYGWTYYSVKARFYIFFVLPLDLSGKNILTLIALYAVLVAATHQWSILIVYSLVAYVAYDHCKKKKKKRKNKQKGQKQEKKPVKRNEMQRGFKRIVKEDLADPEIDAILDKILAQGMDSLTAKEKEILESRSSSSEKP